MTSAAPPTVRPGPLTALLADVAGAPEPGAGWDVPLLPGERVGRFEIAREIGHGGFGVVYEALDRELGRAVAFKAVPAPPAAPADLRVLAEAEAAARLAHPNIVHLYDVGREARGAFLIMELLHGETLAERLARAPLPLRDAVRVAAEVARGVAHAHAQGVVHRDLKPGNVFLCQDGQVKVLDFGMAHVFGRAGLAGGTPAYMAPEQAAGEPGDARADVYSLGVVLRELVPSPPTALARLAGRMTEGDPARRPADAGEVHAALTAIQRALEPKRLLWTVSALAALAVAAAGALALRRAPLPPGRLLVAMADTVNATGDPDLDGVGTLLATALEQSRRLSILARSRVFGWARAGRGAAPARVDERLASDAGRSLRASAIVIPAVRRTGGALEVELRAVDLTRGEPLFTVRERVPSKGVLPAALDRLSARVRGELGETAAQAPPATATIAAALSESPEALRHYAEAKRFESEGRFDDATAAYERAVAADPEFPLAHAELARRTVYFDDAASQRHLDAALRHAERLPPKEAMLLEARRAIWYGRPDEGIALCDRVIAGWPQDPAAHVLAGFALLRVYPDAAAARPYLERALEIAALEPGDAFDALVALGRLDDALALAQRWAAASPGPRAFAHVTLAHRLRGDREAALDAARRVVSFGLLPGTGIAPGPRSAQAFWSFADVDALDEVDEAYRARGLHSWEALALRGRLGEALRALDAEVGRAAERDGSPAMRAAHHGLRANLAWGTGDADLVWSEVAQQVLLGSGAAMCASQLLVDLGDLERASRLMSLWAGTSAMNPRMYCPRLYRHVREWKEGDAEAAARGLAGMQAPEPTYHLGVILGELRRDREAVEAFRRFRRDPAFNFEGANVVAWPRSLYLEAAALERLGERGEALRTVERLLALWRHADPDLPYLKEARALRARLAAAPSR